tara:strand:- start:745 stop:1602 length:858 start_codon:yes stop_codon:yes gene_type:complete
MAFLVKPNLITVEYEEMFNSPEIAMSMDGLRATRVFKVAWANKIKFAKQLIGYVEWITATNVIHRPHTYDLGQDLQKLYAMEVLSIKGFGGLVESPSSTYVAQYNYALLTVEYRSPEYNISNNPAIPLISESIEPVADFVTLNNEGLYWDNGQARKVGAIEAPSFIHRMFDWVYTFHHLSYIPTELILLIGNVNLYSVYSRSLNITFLPGTLLLGNPSLNREHTSIGLTAWSVTVRLTANEMGWNTYPEASNVDADGNMWWGPVYDDSGQVIYPYQPADFSGVIL